MKLNPYETLKLHGRITMSQESKHDHRSMLISQSNKSEVGALGELGKTAQKDIGISRLL